MTALVCSQFDSLKSYAHTNLYCLLRHHRLDSKREREREKKMKKESNAKKTKRLWNNGILYAYTRIYFFFFSLSIRLTRALIVEVPTNIHTYIILNTIIIMIMIIVRYWLSSWSLWSLLLCFWVHLRMHAAWTAYYNEWIMLNWHVFVVMRFLTTILKLYTILIYY